MNVMKKSNIWKKELDEEQLRHDQIGGQITALKNDLGLHPLKPKACKVKLQQAQENLLRKEQEQQKAQEKLTALSQELTELKTTLFEKKSILLNSNNILNNPNNSLV